MITNFIRKNIQRLQAYSSARSEFSGNASIFLDANENPYGQLNRYPDPYQKTLKQRLSVLKNIALENIFLGNGSDEIIDLAFRICCEPGQDKALAFSPSYGMYEVSAAINNIELTNIPLSPDFQIDRIALEEKMYDDCYKLCFICSPNNPTGNSFNESDILFILKNFKGLVILDEAYIDFSTQKSWLAQLRHFDNLMIIQTFSKAWGLAAVRVGVAYAQAVLLSYFNKVKPPYNISSLNQAAVLEALAAPEQFERNRGSILVERDRLAERLKDCALVKKVYPSDANFLLLEVTDADELYQYLLSRGIVVRNRNKVVPNCLRISIGTLDENDRLLAALEEKLVAKG
jgi:histidinol-phosphate aminotransferase